MTPLFINLMLILVDEKNQDITPLSIFLFVLFLVIATWVIGDMATHSRRN